MARRKGWSGNLSEFGVFLKNNDVDRSVIAGAIGVTPAYISLLAHGKAKPGLQTAVAIERWTRGNAKGGEFTCDAWYPEAAAA